MKPTDDPGAPEPEHCETCGAWRPRPGDRAVNCDRCEEPRVFDESEDDIIDSFTEGEE